MYIAETSSCLGCRFGAEWPITYLCDGILLCMCNTDDLGLHLVRGTLGLTAREVRLQERIVEEHTHVVWLTGDKKKRSFF